MSTIYLIRHGQASFGADNYDQLSPIGYRQAAVTGKFLSRQALNIQQVVTGDMQRHRQTADHCLAEIGFNGERITDRKWNEFDHQAILAAYNPQYSDIAGVRKDIAHLPDPMPAFQRIFEEALGRWCSGQYDNEYPESWQQLIGRSMAGFESLVPQVEKGKTTLVFTSGGIISALMSHLLQIPLQQTLALQWLMPNCSISKIMVHKSRFTVSTLNEYSFLEMHEGLLTYR